MGGDDPVSGIMDGVKGILDDTVKPTVDLVTGQTSDRRRKAELRASKKREEARKKQLKARRTREKTEETIKETEKNRSQRRSRQKRATKAGRAGTILSDSLGAGGGDSDDKKTLLGK